MNRPDFDGGSEELEVHGTITDMNTSGSRRPIDDRESAFRLGRSADASTIRSFTSKAHSRRIIEAVGRQRA